MNPREIVRSIIGGREIPRTAFWLGNPHEDALPALHRYFGTTTLEELQTKLGSDFRWLTPQYLTTTYRHPEGKGLFDVWKFKHSLAEPGPLAACTTVDQIDHYEWPSPDYLSFDESLAVIRASGDVYRASGFWMPFFHDVTDLFGIEEFMLKMYTEPEVVHAAFQHVCTFYLEANAKFYIAAQHEIDALFFGNDFGTQRDLLISLDQFDEFILPWIKKFTGQAKEYNLQVILHSCGSVHSIVGRLIDVGVQCLHPLQARAAKMDPVTLSKDFKESIAFLGGVDTQELLVNGTPQQVRDEVKRLKNILGPRLIVSPSHEALLPNVPPQNIAAMAEEALR